MAKMLIIIQFIASLILLEHVNALPARNDRRQLAVNSTQHHSAAVSEINGSQLESNGWEEESPVIDVEDDPRPVVSFAPQGSLSPVVIESNITTMTDIVESTPTATKLVNVVSPSSTEDVGSEATQGPQPIRSNKVTRAAKAKDLQLLFINKEDADSVRLNKQATSQRERARNSQPRHLLQHARHQHNKRALMPVKVTQDDSTTPSVNGVFNKEIEWFDMSKQRGEPAERWTDDYLQECYRIKNWKEHPEKGKDEDHYNTCMKLKKEQLNWRYPE